MQYIKGKGDDLTIISWFNRRVELSALNLDGWCLYIRELESSFLQLDACHVYREHNVIADGLSKEALSLASGLIHYSELSEGVCLVKGTL